VDFEGENEILNYEVNFFVRQLTDPIVGSGSSCRWQLPAGSEDFRFDPSCSRTEEKLSPTKLRIALSGMKCSNLS
jgi:hypothetical protein